MGARASRPRSFCLDAWNDPRSSINRREYNRGRIHLLSNSMSHLHKYNSVLQCITMAIEYATVKAKGQVVIPVDIRRRFQIGEGTRVAFLEEGGRLFVQPVTDEFIDGMKGFLSGRGLPERVER